jgi:hypothetical protein
MVVDSIATDRAATVKTFTPTLPDAAAFDELNGSLKKGEILLVVGRIGAIDLDPFSCACHAARLERNDVVLGKLQFRRGGNGQAQQETIWLGDLPVGVLRPDGGQGRLYYVQPDALGTPRAVIDPTRGTQGLAVWRWDLAGEAFGADAPDQDPDGDETWAARLAAATVPADPAVLTDPRAFSVAPGGKPSVERLTTVTPTIAITAGQVDVTVTNAVAGLKVLLVLGKAGGPAPEVLTGALTAGPATFAVNLGKGVWRAVAFVAGRPPAAKEVTIT